MTHKIAFANQKGGVGKTTSAVSIGAELAALGRRVLLVDLDPQCSATSGVGCQPIAEGPDIYDLFLGDVGLERVIIQTPIANLDLIPSSRDLVSLEVEIGKKPGRELILKTGLSLLAREYDYVLMDCPPSSGLLTLNALGAADKVLVPLQAEYYALEGLSALMNTIQFVQGTFNPQLGILGVFMTMYDSRTNLSAQVEGEARNFFQELMFEARIPRSIKISEAPSHGLPIGLYDPASPGAAAYRRLAAQIDERCFGAQEFTPVANG
ncbi:MAG: ParA family protein [Proteobacteria bacterium]|nr:ParA family protein [Pseudomonadota bacterium]